MSDPAAKPREARESVFLSAVVTGFGQSVPTTHRARNVSPNGVCVDKAETLKRGQTVVVDIGMLEAVGATVRWVEGTLAGLKFAHPIRIDAAKTRPKPAHIQQGWAGAVPSGR
jgi:hypothetical protein